KRNHHRTQQDLTSLRRRLALCQPDKNGDDSRRIDNDQQRDESGKSKSPNGNVHGGELLLVNVTKSTRMSLCFSLSDMRLSCRCDWLRASLIVGSRSLVRR